MRGAKRWLGAVATLLVVLSASPAGAATREGTWKGETSQALKIRFIVGGDERIKTIDVKIEYENTTCVRDVTWGFGLDARIRDDDTFRVNLVDDNDDRDSALVRGEFVSRRRAEGTFRGTFFDGGACNGLEAKGTWVAKRV